MLQNAPQARHPVFFFGVDQMAHNDKGTPCAGPFRGADPFVREAAKLRIQGGGSSFEDRKNAFQ